MFLFLFFVFPRKFLVNHQQQRKILDYEIIKKISLFIFFVLVGFWTKQYNFYAYFSLHSMMMNGKFVVNASAMNFEKNQKKRKSFCDLLLLLINDFFLFNWIKFILIQYIFNHLKMFSTFTNWHLQWSLEIGRKLSFQNQVVVFLFCFVSNESNPSNCYLYTHTQGKITIKTTTKTVDIAFMKNEFLGRFIRRSEIYQLMMIMISTIWCTNVKKNYRYTDIL